MTSADGSSSDLHRNLIDKDVPRQGKPSLIKGKLLPSNRYLVNQRACGLDDKTRAELRAAEYYHFLIIQIRWNTIITFLISICELAMFFLCIYSMDYE
jgi:hypothetical protein